MVMPMHTPPVGAVKVIDSFFKPVDRPRSVTQPTDMDRPQSVDSLPASGLSGTDLPTQQRQVTGKLTSELARKQNESGMDTI